MGTTHQNVLKALLWSGVVDASSLQNARFFLKPAEGDKPAHWHVRVHQHAHDHRSPGVDLHLSEDLNPQGLGCVLVEIKRRTFERAGCPKAEYVYANFSPAPDGMRPTQCFGVGPGRSSNDRTFQESHGGALHLSPIR